MRRQLAAALWVPLAQRPPGLDPGRRLRVQVGMTLRFTIAIVLVLAGIVVLLWLPERKPRVHMIDALDLMRFHEARRAGYRGRPRWVWGVIMTIIAIVLASLLWGLLG